MKPVVRNIFAVIVGVVIGNLVNGGLIMNMGAIMSLPEGVDMSTAESAKATIHLLQQKHFIMVFLAHALGTFFGATIAVIIAANHKMRFALGFGIFFLIGGIAACFMIPAPTWYMVVDLLLAYLPMAWLGGKLGMKLNPR